MAAPVEEIDRRISAIRDDRLHGATYLTAKGLAVLRDAAGVPATDAEWEPGLAAVAARLAAAKPAMAGLGNAAGMLLTRLLELGPDVGRRMAVSLCEELLAELGRASEAAASNAGLVIPDCATLLTCSYSSAVLRVCSVSRRHGKSLRVVVFEPAAGPEAPGRRLAAELDLMGCPAAAVGDRPVERIVAETQVALMGADAVTPEFVVNGAPSLALAEAAKGRVPLYAVCESVKFAGGPGVGSGYDRVPLDLVTAIVTEEGALSPEEAARRAAGSGWRPAHPSLRRAQGRPTPPPGSPPQAL